MSKLKNRTLPTLLIFAATQLPIAPAAQAAAAPAVGLSTARSCKEIRYRVIDTVVSQALATAPRRHRWPQSKKRQQPPRRSVNKSVPAPTPRSGMDAISSGMGSLSQAPAAPSMERESFSKSSRKDEAQADPANFTGTNTQEAGVDEADIVETDGRFIYTVQKGELLILKSWPASATSIVSRLKLASHISPVQLLLRDDRLVMISQVNQTLPSYAREQRRNGGVASTLGQLVATRVVLVDIADRAAPRLEEKYDIEGQLVQARLVEEDLYLVTRSQLHVPPRMINTARKLARKYPGKRSLIRANVDDVFGSREMATIMPRTREGMARDKMNGLERLYDCGDVYLLEEQGLAVLNVSHLDTARPAGITSVGIQSTSQHVYASQEALYVAGQPRHYPGVNRGTGIHKFALLGREGSAVRYQASGVVDGYLLNQFAMSEHQGDLRVAATSNQRGDNNLYVLRQRGKSLIRVGAVTGLARGERIYAVRMFGDKGYVVTFRRTDPLYTLDLSEPSNPRVVGELKIPGFSSYIHPLDEGHLLTIGQDADQRGRVRGLHLQVFDVSDMAKPRRTVQKLVNPNGNATSAAQANHLAFTFDSWSRTLAIPVQLSGRERFVGLALYQVGDQSIEELGKISHAPLLSAYLQRVSGQSAGHRAHMATPPIARSIIMEDFVYTLSGLGLQVNQLRSPDRLEAGVLFAREAAPNNRLTAESAPLAAR